MKQETKRKIEISNLHEFADSLILIDNRIDRCKKHQASTIVLIAISAVICGADTWNSIEDFGKSKESFCKLSNFNGIPSHDTFNRFFSALDPLKFEESYRQWVQSILKCYSGHIAIDGKTIRGPYESEQDKRHRKQGCFLIRIRESTNCMSSVHLQQNWESPLDSYVHKKRKMR